MIDARKLNAIKIHYVISRKRPCGLLLSNLFLVISQIEIYENLSYAL